MKKMLAVAAAAAMCAGCATPSQSLMETGERSEHTLRRAPPEAVSCMSRNIEAAGYTVDGTLIRSLDVGGSELIVGTMLLAQARPVDTGSLVTTWLRAAWFYQRDNFIARAIDGC